MTIDCGIIDKEALQRLLAVTLQDSSPPTALRSQGKSA